MNIVFMGTPNFAAVCLESIISSKHNVTGVFAQQKGRGRDRRVPTWDLPAFAKEFHEVKRLER